MEGLEEMTDLILELFWTFFIIGLFTFGGGYAVIGIIQSQIVTAKGWVTEGVFTDIVAVSQMTPGPVGLNCSTYVGYEVLKEAGAGEELAVLGSLVSSFAIVLPSFIVMLLIVKFYMRYHNTSTFKSVLSSLRPAVAAMIAAAAFALTVDFRFGGACRIVKENFPDFVSWLLAAAAFIAYTFFRVRPMPLLGFGALAGLLLYLIL